MKVEKRAFGKYEGEDIEQYVLSNDQGMKVKIITYGATISSIELPTADGHVDVVCGFNSMEGYQSEAYLANAPYFGCTVGRFASRIKDGRFSVDGMEYSVATNDGSNHLHGGVKAFNKRIWKGEVIDGGVAMSLFSPHMEEGFPGNVQVTVQFVLNEANELSISYHATTDQKTPLSLTNHSYFNLSGFQKTIEDTQATILADCYLKPDTTNVPNGELASVVGDPSDLREGKRFSEALAQMETGFEHYYVFDENTELRKVAIFDEPATDCKLEILTTEPGMLFYSGYFTSDALHRESGEQYGRYRGFCCETHRYPNGPNIAGAPEVFATPGAPYKSQTVYRFDF
ncbi:galactose mutarotase [Reichenbachiella sp. 5M10]|uniref:aldose epimerase family protein n=1 Tax=Reichenbachiella sp. 5M10 TaxID=1889772 RepID=UPI000C15A505|nr:aldose epimerase family protein [Reichenbachiella sp. 5M10]PIB35637.1 galactose mutarotase [Reichenbachiella sp. 5M10]